MQLPLTKKEIVLLSVILAGVVMGYGLILLPKPAVLAFPDLGREEVETATTESDAPTAGVSRADNARASVSSGRSSRDVSESSGPVNINTAGEIELARLKGIGPALAKRIIEYREAHGRFKCVDDLQRVNGIGPATVAKNKDMAITGS